jgi:hypothetical protein
MICDICIEGNIESNGAYCMDGVTICRPCLAKAIVFYCEHHTNKPPATKVTVTPESVKEARKEDNVRGWWA